MEEKYTRIAHFLESCTALMECDFRTAEGRIREILQSIAASSELTQLFTAVTKGFDYAAARRTYLRYPAANGSPHGAAYLPAARRDILAFVFCLLVEFDAGTLKLDDFLLRYFYVDGSYTASFLIFTDRVVKPFRDIVAGCFPALPQVPKAEMLQEELPQQPPQTFPQTLPQQEFPQETFAQEIPQQEFPQETFAQEIPQDTFAPAAALIQAERARVLPAEIGEEGRAAAEVILDGLAEAAKLQDVTLFTAVLAGYKYFLRDFGLGSAPELFAFAATL